MRCRRPGALTPPLRSADGRHARLRLRLERGGQPRRRPDRAGVGASDADLLVVDELADGRDGRRRARLHGADVLSFGENRGLRAGIAAGYGAAAERGYAYCGRVDADGQHPAAELRRLLQLVRDGECDVAVGSCFVSGDGYSPYRYEPSPARRLGIGLLRRAMRIRLGRRFGDATSGMYAANAMALPFLAELYTSGAPEVEGLIRLAEAGLTVEEVPVNMREARAGRSCAARRRSSSCSRSTALLLLRLAAPPPVSRVVVVLGYSNGARPGFIRVRRAPDPCRRREPPRRRGRARAGRACRRRGRRPS